MLVAALRLPPLSLLAGCGSPLSVLTHCFACAQSQLLLSSYRHKKPNSHSPLHSLSKQHQSYPQITPKAIFRLFSAWTGLPLTLETACLSTLQRLLTRSAFLVDFACRAQRSWCRTLNASVGEPPPSFLFSGQSLLLSAALRSWSIYYFILVRSSGPLSSLRTPRANSRALVPRVLCRWQTRLSRALPAHDHPSLGQNAKHQEEKLTVDTYWQPN